MYSTELYMYIPSSVVHFLRLCLGCVGYHSFGLLQYAFDPPRKFYTNFRRKFVIALFSSTCIKVKCCLVNPKLIVSWEITLVILWEHAETEHETHCRVYDSRTEMMKTAIDFLEPEYFCIYIYIYIYIYGFMFMIVVPKQDNLPQ